MSKKHSTYKQYDGFSVELNSAMKVAYVILDRPPLNVVSMSQREDFADIFKTLDIDNNVRVVVLKARGKNFSSGGDIQGFMDSDAGFDF